MNVHSITLIEEGQRACADAWHQHASELADWAWTWLVHRTDRFGCQVLLADGSINRVTGSRLKRKRLVRHFRACEDPSTADIIGVHVTAPDETCRWIAIDIDRHSDEDPDTNLRFALRILKRCRKAGLAAVLIDSSGGLGGFHIWVVFDHKIPMADARRLVLWLARGWNGFGLPKRPDLFPGNDHLTGKRCGTWLRLPGRHHKRISWSRVWSPAHKTWLEGNDAVAALLALKGGRVDVAAIVPENFGRPQPHVGPAGKLRSYDHDEDRELGLARDALRFYTNDDLHYDDWLEIMMALRQFDDEGRELFHEWSELSGKYNRADLDRRWESAKSGEHFLSLGRLVTVATLFKRARDAGWPGPAFYGLRYSVGIRRTPGPVLVVQGDAAFAVLDDRGYTALGLPRDEPCLRKAARLLGERPRDVVVIGTREPLFEPEPVARVLETLLSYIVKVTSPPEPYRDVPSWIAARHQIKTPREERTL